MKDAICCGRGVHGRSEHDDTEARKASLETYTDFWYEFCKMETRLVIEHMERKSIIIAREKIALFNFLYIIEERKRKESKNCRF